MDGKAAESISTNHTTALIINHHRRDLNALANENLTLVDTALFSHKQISNNLFQI